MKNDIRQPQQERSIEKKNRIIQAGYELFSEIGYYGTNTVEIAERAELRRNGEHHVGDTEHDMRNEQRAEAFFDREDAEKHQK